MARAVAAVWIDAPPYLDAAYYELVARQLATGHGVTSPALWSFLEVGGQLPASPALPVASNGHWMPLTSIIAAGSMLIFGPSRLAAELPMVFIGAALVPLTALVAWELWRQRRIAVVSGLLAVFAGPMLVYVPVVDSFAAFGLAGFCAIYSSVRAVRSPTGGRWLLLAGFGVGVATLARIDGMLLAVAPATAWLVRRGIGPRVPLPPLSCASAIAAALFGVAVLTPWLLRQQIVFGTPFPSAGGHTLWITSYNEQFSIGHPVDIGSYLAWGPVPIIGSKLASWALLVGRTAVLLGGTFVLSFGYGLWTTRRHPELLPFTAYFVVLFAVMGGLFTFHAPQGAWYHSAWAWLPFAIPISVGAFDGFVASIGRRWRLLARERNRRFLFGAAVIGAVVLSLVGSVALWRDSVARAGRVEAAAMFLETTAHPDDVIMAVDPPSLTLRTGLHAVAPPFDPFPVIGEVVDAYDVRWVVVERTAGGGDPLGMWDGRAAVDAEGNRASFLSDRPAFDDGAVRVFEVERDR
jgi:hypothetical protein